MEDIKWPRRIVVIRHGQSEQNVALDLLQDNLAETLQKQKEIRDADIKLTEYGVWQAQQTGKLLSKEEAFDYCFSSPYKRTMQTSKNIIENIGYDLKILTDNRLREKEFGKLHGYSKKEIKKQFENEHHDRKRDGKYWYRLPNGENYPDVQARLHSFLGKLHRDYKGKNVLIVTHQVPCKLFRALFEHAGEDEVLNYEVIENCGMEQFDITTEKYPEGRMKLTYFNKKAYKQGDFKS